MTHTCLLLQPQTTYPAYKLAFFLLLVGCTWTCKPRFSSFLLIALIGTLIGFKTWEPTKSYLDYNILTKLQLLQLYYPLFT